MKQLPFITLIFLSGCLLSEAGDIEQRTTERAIYPCDTAVYVADLGWYNFAMGLECDTCPLIVDNFGQMTIQRVVECQLGVTPICGNPIDTTEWICIGPVAWDCTGGLRVMDEGEMYSIASKVWAIQETHPDRPKLKQGSSCNIVPQFKACMSSTCPINIQVYTDSCMICSDDRYSSGPNGELYFSNAFVRWITTESN